MIFRALWVIGIYCLTSLTASPARAESLEIIATRPGVTQAFLLERPERPKAVLLLFPGGNGALRLAYFHGVLAGRVSEDSFLVRTRAQLAARGFVVVVMDAPSDQSDNDGMLGGFRATGEHAQDVAVVIDYVRYRTNLPVWLVGTSRGTESVGNIASRLTERVNGIVMISSVTNTSRHGISLLEMELDKIRAPVLLMAHEEDACEHTPLYGAQRLLIKLAGGGTGSYISRCENEAVGGISNIQAVAVTQ